MAPVDIMLSSSIIAATFLQTASLLAHKKYKLYDVFIGKKYAFMVHAALVSIAWLQVVGITVYAYFSRWKLVAVPPLGVLVACAGVYVFVKAVQEIGISALWNKSVFGGRTRVMGSTYKRYKHPMYLGVLALYVGVGLLTGNGGYYLAAATLVPCLFMLSLAEKDKQQKLKHEAH